MYRYRYRSLSPATYTTGQHTRVLRSFVCSYALFF